MTDSRTRRKDEPDYRSPGEVRKWESRQLGRACSAEFCCSVLFSQGPETFSWKCIVKCSDCGLFENLTTRTCLYVSSRGDQIRKGKSNMLADSIRWDQIRGASNPLWHRPRVLITRDWATTPNVATLNKPVTFTRIAQGNHHSCSKYFIHFYYMKDVIIASKAHLCWRHPPCPLMSHCRDVVLCVCTLNW